MSIDQPARVAGSQFRHRLDLLAPRWRGTSSVRADGECQGVRAVSRIVSVCAATLALVAGVVSATFPWAAIAQEGDQVLSRHIGTSRARAAERPRSEGDQAIVAGWPLYRTERGQAAYNAAMATLAVTEGRAPTAADFRNCADLGCELALPLIARDGWIPAGRIWTSPTDYVIVAHSARPGGTRRLRRHSYRSMRYFVFHEFHNSSRNTDPYDTISSHSGEVFVPFYMSKQGRDARGRRFVVIMQVAPYDVVSVHATNYGSAGPGVEVAANTTDELEPLQARAGLVLAAIITRAAPHLRVVNHRGNEGLAMLEAHEARMAAVRTRRAGGPLALPFVPAPGERIAAVDARLADLIARPGSSPSIALADRRFVPPRASIAEPARQVVPAEPGEAPRLIGPIQLARRPLRQAFPALVEPPSPATWPAAAFAGSR